MSARKENRLQSEEKDKRCSVRFHNLSSHLCQSLVMKLLSSPAPELMKHIRAERVQICKDDIHSVRSPGLLTNVVGGGVMRGQRGV